MSNLALNTTDYKGIQKAIALASQSKAPQGYDCTHIHLYTDRAGKFIYGKPRYKHPTTGDKWIRSYSLDSNNNWQMKDPDFTLSYPDGQGKKPLYRLHELVAGNEVVYIFEGEQKADYANSLGLIATTAGGSTGVNSHDWQVLGGRDCILWRDNDTAGDNWLSDVLTALQPLNGRVSVIDVDKLNLPAKGDIMDFSQMLYADGEDDLSILQAIKNLPILTDEQVINLLPLPVNASVSDDEPPGNMTYEQAQIKVNDLAKLDELQFSMQKREVAKLIGIGVNDLEKAVNKARQGLEMGKIDKIIKRVEPHSQAVNGDELAGEIYQLITRHIACDDSVAVVVTLWVFFTWCIDVAYIAPIAWINAPEKGCGKTTLAGLMGRMCKNTLPTSNITPSALFRSIESFKPTLVIDEADSFMKDNVELKNIINAGFSRENCYLIRSVGDNHEPTPFNVFGAKVISGIGKLPPTIIDRSISLTLKRKLAHENKARLKNLPTATTDLIQAKLARWADDNMDRVQYAKPQLPEMLYNRGFDTWEILYQIAEVLGGHWLQLITNACLHITGSEPAEPSLNEELLSDIKAIFDTQQVEAIPTRDLLTALISPSADGDTRAWISYNRGNPLTDRQLAKRLREFGIRPKQVRFGEKNLMGYKLDDFKDVFLRYLPKV